MKRSRAPRLALGAVAVCALSLPFMAGPAAAQNGCSNYATYSALGSAAGVRTVQSTEGVTIVDSIDGNLPAAQAEFDSLAGSLGWAGAPYSATVADNLEGTVGSSPNDVPVFLTSSYPVNPDPPAKETPIATLKAKSGPDSSTASAVGGGPESGAASTGHVSTSATASCSEDGTLQAVADGVVEGVDISGVLRIGSVRSHARVVVDPQGRKHLEGTTEVEAATVLGQPVSITDQGVVIGSQELPLPGNPLADALINAGITVRYVAAVQDAEQGQVLAPGLELVVSHQVPNVGSGPVTTTYTLGRVYARAATSGDSGDTTVIPIPTSLPSDIVSAPLPSAAKQVAAPPASSARQPVNASIARLANWSIAPAYAALALGALLLLTGRPLFKKIVARVRWS